jgi:hypothetical protein
MSRRSGFAVLTALIALVCTMLVGFGDPAGAVVRELRTSYRCTATASGIDLGAGRARATVRVNLPRQVQVGARIAARDIRFRVRVPSAILDQARTLGVDAVDAASDDAYYRIKRQRKAVRNLTVPRTDVPADGPMVLVGTGRASGHTFDEVGRYPIRLPLAFTASGTAYGAGPGVDQPFELACRLVPDAPERIATIRVVR